jgi:hypothetical protein
MKHHFAASIERLAILQRINDELLRIAMFIFESFSSVMLRFFHLPQWIYHIRVSSVSVFETYAGGRDIWL